MRVAREDPETRTRRFLFGGGSAAGRGREMSKN
jgi:hypothetical protein